MRDFATCKAVGCWRNILARRTNASSHLVYLCIDIKFGSLLLLYVIRVLNCPKRHLKFPKDAELTEYGKESYCRTSNDPRRGTSPVIVAYLNPNTLYLHPDPGLEHFLTVYRHTHTSRKQTIMASGAFFDSKTLLLAGPLVSSTCTLLFARDQDFFLSLLTDPHPIGRPRQSQ